MEAIRNRLGSAGAFFIFTLSVITAASGCTNSTGEKGEQSGLLKTEVPDSRLLLADAVLHQRLQAVHEADERYDVLLAGRPVSTAALDEKNGQIIQAEMALQQTIDSLKQVSMKSADSSKSGLTHLTDYFKATLENRRFFSDMRMIASADNDDSTNMQQALLRLRAEVQQKNRRIAQLEQAAVGRNKQAALDLPTTATPLERKLLAPEAARRTTEKAKYAPANGESLEQLKQRNQNLASALNAVQTQYGTLSKYYRQLKQDYDRAQTELTALRKGGNH